MGQGPTPQGTASLFLAVRPCCSPPAAAAKEQPKKIIHKFLSPLTLSSSFSSSVYTVNLHESIISVVHVYNLQISKSIGRQHDQNPLRISAVGAHGPL